MAKNKTKAYIMIISTMFIWGTIGIFRKYIPLSSAMLAFTRGMLGALCLFTYSKIRKYDESPIPLKKVGILAITGVIMGFDWIFLFESYHYTSVSIATLCYYLQPTIVILLSPIMLKEKLTTKKMICATVAIIGMVFVSGVLESGGVQSSDLKGIVMGVAAAFLYALVVVINKMIPAFDPYKKAMIQLLFAAVVLIPYLLITQKSTDIQISSSSIILVLILGLFHTGFAYALYFGSIGELSGQSIAILSYIDPIAALFLSAVILNERLSIFGIIGAVLIMVSSLFSEINLKKK